VVKDDVQAVAWYREAARFSPSQFNLGCAYAKGEGVPRDLKEAYKWFTLGVVTNIWLDPGLRIRATAMLSQLAQEIPQSEIAKAEMEAELDRVIVDYIEEVYILFGKTIDAVPSEHSSLSPAWGSQPSPTASSDIPRIKIGTRVDSAGFLHERLQLRRLGLHHSGPSQSLNGAPDPIRS
jgi:hypothetical protein